jgi:hypothetical protein
MDTENKYYCKQCGRSMGIMEYIIGVVCLKCCKENHARACGKYPVKSNKKSKTARRK